MIKNHWVVGAVLSGLFLTGCSGALKKRCEAENWHEYGKNRGLQGAGIDGDPYFDQCRGEKVPPDMSLVRAGYSQGVAAFCAPDVFFQQGRDGERPNFNLCPADRLGELQKRHQAGVKQHCTKRGAFQRGESGRENPKICSERIQASYNRHYNLGRKKHFQTSVSKKELEMAQLDQRLIAIDTEILKLQRELPEAERREQKQNDPNRAVGKQILDMVVGGDTPAEIQEKISKLNIEKTKLQQSRPKMQEELLALRTRLLEAQSQDTSEDGELTPAPGTEATAESQE